MANKAVNGECRAFLDTLETYLPTTENPAPTKFLRLGCLIASSIRGMVNIRKSPLKEIRRDISVIDLTLRPAKWRGSPVGALKDSAPVTVV